MADHRKSNLYGDCASSCSSSFQKTVVLRDWWLIKCSTEFQGKRFGVAGIEDSVETRARRVFTSSPIIKAFDVFTLQASDGICITLRGFLNKERVVKCGFLPEISREFIFGFPPCWERICNSCFEGVPSIIDKACSPILSPCKYSKGNLADNPAESRDKATVTETNTAEINNKDASRARDKKPTRKSLHLRSKSGESSKVQNTTHEDHGSEGLNTDTGGAVEKDVCEAIDREGNEWKLNDSNIQNRTIDGDHGSECLDKAKSIDVEKDRCEAMNYEDNDWKLNDNNDEDHGSVVKRMSHSRTIVESAENKRKLDVSEVQKSTSNDGDHGTEGVNKRHLGTESVQKVNSDQLKGRVKVLSTSLHSLSKDLSTKPGKRGKSKKSEKTLKRDWNVVEPTSPVSWGKTKRKIDFDVELTPDKEAKKQKTSPVSTDSLGYQRSRSGRVLVSSLEFWRNQLPVYDKDRNLIQVKEGHETNSTPSKGKGSNSRKKIKNQIK